MSNDPNLLTLARTMTEFSLDGAWLLATETGGDQTIGSPFGMGFGKIMGEYLARLHGAVALLAAYDAGQVPCNYPNLVGGPNIECEDVLQLIGMWNQVPSGNAEDRNGNGIIDIHECVLILNCASSCP